MDSKTPFIITPRTIVGLGIACVGVALMLDRLQIVQAASVLRYWPVALMLIGGLMIAQASDGSGRTRGVFFLSIGSWMFLYREGLLPVPIWHLFWPVMLILLGIALAIRPGRPFRGAPEWLQGAPSWRSPHALPGDLTSRPSLFSVMSGVKRSSAASPLVGADITALMGGALLDLRMATIPDGEEAVIDIFAIMGGIEIVVPPTWAIATPIVPFMGAVEDKRLPPTAINGMPAINTPPPRLVIRGFLMMGSVEVKT